MLQKGAGFEGTTQCVQGLWAQPLGFFLDFLLANGFNAIRLPLNTQACLNLDNPNSLPSGIDTAKNPSLAVNARLKRVFGTHRIQPALTAAAHCREKRWGGSWTSSCSSVRPAACGCCRTCTSSR